MKTTVISIKEKAKTIRKREEEGRTMQCTQRVYHVVMGMILVGAFALLPALVQAGKAVATNPKQDVTVKESEGAKAKEAYTSAQKKVVIKKAAAAQRTATSKAKKARARNAGANITGVKAVANSAITQNRRATLMVATPAKPDEEPGYRHVPEYDLERDRIPDQNDLLDILRAQREKDLREHIERDLNDPRKGWDRSPPRRPWVDSWPALHDYCESDDADPTEWQDICVDSDYEGGSDWTIESGDDSDDDWIMIFDDGTVDDGSGETQTDVHEDNDGEGNDGDGPDELRSPVFEEALASGADTSVSGESGSGTGSGSGQGSMQGQGFPNQNHGRLGPAKDPEGGGPDNIKGGVANPSAASTGVADNIKVSPQSAVSWKDPDNPNPPRPDVVEGATPAATASGNTSVRSSATASPVVGNPGDPPPPPPPGPGPEFGK